MARAINEIKLIKNPIKKEKDLLGALIQQVEMAKDHSLNQINMKKKVKN